MATVAQFRNRKRYLSFNGSSSYIGIPHNTGQYLGTTFTMEAWIYPTRSVGEEIIMNKESSYEWALQAGQLAWAIMTAGNWEWRYTGIYPAINTWSHIAFTYDGTKVYAFLNGELKNEIVDYQGGDITDTTSELRIGRRGGSSYYQGRMRDVRLWSSYRTPEEIRHGMYAIGGKELGLIGHWPLGEGTGTNASSSTGSQHGNIYNCTWGEEVGTTDMLVKEEFRESKVFFSRAKQYPDDGYDPTAGLYNDKGTKIWDYGRDWHISVWDTLTNNWATGINFNGASWSDGTHGRYDTWDSTNRATQQQAFTDTLNNLTSQYAVIIAASHAPENFNTAMKDAIKRCGGSDAKLGWAGNRWSYICVGTPGVGAGNAQVEVLNNISTSPTWAEAYADTGYEIDSFSATANGYAYTEEISEVPDCIQFDGVDDRAVVSNHADLQITGNQTIELIMKPTNVARARQNPYNKAYGGEGTITQETSGSLSYYWGTSGGNSGTYQGVGSPSGTCVNGETLHAVLVRDITNNYIKWYKDGTEVTSVAPSFTAATAGTNPVILCHGYTSYWEGVMYEIRLWNRALTPTEVQNGAFKPVDNDEPGLVALWKFDEGYGQVVEDQASNRHHGDLTGGTRTYSYDGSSALGSDGTVKIKGEFIEGVDF